MAANDGTPAIAGIGHIIMAAGIILLLISLIKSAKNEE